MRKRILVLSSVFVITLCTQLSGQGCTPGTATEELSVNNISVGVKQLAAPWHF